MKPLYGPDHEKPLITTTVSAEDGRPRAMAKLEYYGCQVLADGHEATPENVAQLTAGAEDILVRYVLELIRVQRPDLWDKYVPVNSYLRANGH